MYTIRGEACSSWCFRPSRATDRGFLPCPPQTRHTHRQVRVSTSFGGLVGFKPNASQGELPHWKSWNHITVASDQGADMVSGVFSLMYMSSIKCNVTVFFDVSHGANRDFWCAVSENSMKGFLLCVMVVLNLPHGPDDSYLRYNQIRDSMLEHYRMSSCTMSPIFEQLATDILKERDDVGPEECESPEAALWRVLSVDTFYKRKGYRVNISRFFSVVAESIKLLARWHTMLFEVSVPAIELGMLSNMTLPRIKLCTKGGDPDGDPDATSRKNLATDERSLRSCGANALVIAFSLLSDKNNRRSLACMCLLAQPCMDFHGASSRALRDVNSSKVWLLEQNRGGIYKHMCETMDLLGDLDFLGATGFLSKASGGIEHMTNDEVQHDCDFAAFAGAFCTSLMKARLRRTLYLSGYPHCFILLLGTSREQTHLIDKLRSDHQNYEDLKAVPRPSALAKAYLERSPFNLL